MSLRALGGVDHTLLGSELSMGRRPPWQPSGDSGAPGSSGASLTCRWLLDAVVLDGGVELLSADVTWTVNATAPLGRTGTLGITSGGCSI